MAQFKVNERIYETSVTTGTGEYTLVGAQVGFQPVSVIGANNYGPFFITDDVNWEAGLYTFIAGPNRLQRTTVKASSNGGAPVNWGVGTKKVRCGWPAWLAAPSVATKSVAGAVDVTLTAAEQRCDILILTGAITANINVIVDTTPWSWVLYNNTTGAYTATLKTSAGTGIAVAQGKRSALHCDGTNVQRAVDEMLPLSGGTMTGDIAMSGASIFDANASIAAHATTMDPWSLGNYVTLTGTAVTFSALTAAPQAGAEVELYMNAAHVFTDGAVFEVDGDASYTATIGDRVVMRAKSTTVFTVHPRKADGTAVVAPASTAAASQAEQETGSSTTVYVSPGRQHFHQSALKLWGSCGIAGDLNSPSYNITSVGDTGTGRATITIGTDFSSAVYAFTATGITAAGNAAFVLVSVKSAAQAAGSVEIHGMDEAGTVRDPTTGYCFSAAGDFA